METISTRGNMSSGWATLLGVALILLGVAAIAQPLVATVAATLFLGWLFVIGGAVKLIYSVVTRERGLIWKSLLSVLYFASGLFLLLYPLAGLITLTLIVGTFFIIKGLTQVAFAFDWRPEANWGWTLTAGIAGIVLGLLILAGLPTTAAWAVGLLVGINLFFDGIWVLMLPSKAMPVSGEESRERETRRAA